MNRDKWLKLINDQRPKLLEGKDLEKITDDEIFELARMAMEPEKVLPKMAAQVYMTAYENIVKAISQAMPGMIQSTMATQSAVERATDEFYGKWTKLDRNNPEHNARVQRIATVYRQMNPTASQEQFIAEVGAQALMALGIPFADIVDAPAPEAQQKPFVPAAPTGAAPVRAAPKPMNAYEVLAEELLNDDS